MFTQTIIVYNGNLDVSNKKIWILIDNVKIINNVNINNKNILTVTISPSNKALELINMIENIILLKIKSIVKNDEIILKSKLCNSSDYIIKFDIVCGSDTIFFDVNDDVIDEICDIEDIDENISIICELDEILFNNISSSVMWKTIQIKKMSKLNLKISLFNTKIKKSENTIINSKPELLIHENKINENKKPEIRKPMGMSLFDEMANFKFKKKNDEPVINIIEPIKKLAFSLTPDLLNQSISGLKKTNILKDEVKDSSIIEIPKLNHIVTKEPASYVNMLKNEYKVTKIENIYDFILNECNKIKKNKKKMKKLNKKFKKLNKKFILQKN
jgi:uncharacterized coiled-coil protein SlyX